MGWLTGSLIIAAQASFGQPSAAPFVGCQQKGHPRSGVARGLWDDSDQRAQVIQLSNSEYLNIANEKYMLEKTVK